MKKLYLIIPLLFLSAALFSQPPGLLGIPTNNLTGNSIPMYEKFEVDLKLDRTVPNDYETPHDSDEISLYAIFYNPQTKNTFTIHLFYSEPYIGQSNPCVWPVNKKPDAMFPKSSFSPAGNSGNDYLQSWKMRCAFKETGLWNYSIFGRDKYSPGSFTKLYSDSVNVTPPNQTNYGFIRKSDNNNTYLFFDNGKMCFLNGVNEFFAENKETFICRMKGLIDKMTENNINFMRMWIDGNPGWYFTADLQGEALGDEYCTSIFNQRNARILDEIIDYARIKNMYIQPCLYAPCLNDEGWNKGFTYQNAFNQNNPKHNTTRYNTPNVGEITDPWEFFNPSILKYMRNYIKYCTSRWGYATNIVGWEIGNEMNPTNSTFSVLGVPTPYNQPNQFSAQLKEWHKNFKKYLNYYDAHKHLVTTSLQSEPGRSGWKKYPVSNELFDIFSMMDYTNSHNYYINPTCPEKTKCEKLEEQEDANFSTNTIYHSEMSKPTQVQEWGLGDDKCNPGIPNRGYYEMDPFGVSHHNVVLSSAFAGGMGTACTFNSWADLQPCDYYYHYKGIGEFMNKFGNLGNPLFVKKERTLFNNKGNTSCPNTDFSEEGLRYYYMANSSKLVIGWCQDKRFSFSRLYWRDIDSNLNYLKSMEMRFKPSTDNSPNTFTIKVPQKGYYKIRWYQPLDVGKPVQKESIIRSFSPNPLNEQFIKMELPKSLHNAKLADGLFSVIYHCEQKLSFEIPKMNSFHYGDKIPIKLNEFAAIDAVGLTVDRVTSQGLIIETLFKKTMNAKDFQDSGKRELNYLYNLTNPLTLDIPLIDNKTTYYKLTITPLNPENLMDCSVTSNSDPVFFQVSDCHSKPVLTINGKIGSTILNPITVQHGEPINLDGSGSYGGTGYRIIIKETDALNNYIGAEYNMRYDGAFDKIIDANNVVNEATSGIQKYLPSDGSNQYRLYQIFHVNYNSYAPYSGCSDWEQTSEFVKVTCSASARLEIVGGGTGTTKEFAFGEPVLIDGRKSAGETGYRIIIQQTDLNNNSFGPVYNKHYVGNIDKLIDLNPVINELSSGKYKYLPSDITGASYYKIKLVVFNAYNDGGCKEWELDSSVIKISSCRINVEFNVNSDPGGNSKSTPYLYKHGAPLYLDGLNTKGETGYRIILNLLDSNGLVSNNYDIPYKKSLEDLYELNEWYRENVNPAMNNIPSNSLPENNLWEIRLKAYNYKTEGGCDDMVVKSLFFKITDDLKCDFILNSENPLNHQTMLNEICDNSGANLNPLSFNYGCDKYTVTMDELESATWLPGNPKPLITYERYINGQPQYINRRRTSETIDSKTLTKIDLEEFWYRRTGYQIDKNRSYKVTLTTNDNSQNCSDFWTFRYKPCAQFIDANPADQNQLPFRKATQISEIKNSDQSDLVNVAVYPNPSSSFITVSISNSMITGAKIEIYDLCSKNVYSGTMNESNSKIDISAFNNGVYFLKVMIDHQLFNFKIIKL